MNLVHSLLNRLKRYDLLSISIVCWFDCLFSILFAIMMAHIFEVWGSFETTEAGKNHDKSDLGLWPFQAEIPETGSLEESPVVNDAAIKLGSVLMAIDLRYTLSRTANSVCSLHLHCVHWKWCSCTVIIKFRGEQSWCFCHGLREGQ